MCTVSIVPNTSGGVQLISNRDEKVLRKTNLPNRYLIGDEWVFFPKDHEKGGTWIAIGSSGRVVCLLNGGRSSHTPTGFESKSRGQVVLDVFNYNSVKDFANHFSYENCEPFTLLVLDDWEANDLTEFVWDGTRLEKTIVPIGNGKLWSSSTLYNDEVKLHRQKAFNKKIEFPKNRCRLVKELHLSQEVNGFILSGQNLRTVSTTIISTNQIGFSMIYNDLLQNKTIRILEEWKTILQSF